MWNALISYSYLTGDSSYNSIISEALQHQSGDYNAFMPRNQTASLGNDDQSTWGLAALTAAEIGFPKPQQGEWLDKAIMVFDTQVLRWDNATCGGGLRWQLFTFNNGYDYKNSVTNANFFLLSARLARLTGNSTYAEWAGKSYNWAKEIGLVVDRDGKGTVVYDGTSTMKNCSDLNHIQWSSDLGTYLEGAAVMYNLVRSPGFSLRSDKRLTLTDKRRTKLDSSRKQPREHNLQFRKGRAKHHYRDGLRE